MATNSYLIISDGPTTATFADGSGGSTNYEIQRGGWAPGVAGLRRSQLGGAGPYEDVVEELQLNLTGSSIDAALANLNVLNGLLDQAERWYNGENTCAVLVKYSPNGATVSNAASPLQAPILGRANDAGGAIGLPSVFEDVGFNRFVVGATVRFVRRGLWLHTTASAAELPTSPSNGTVGIIALPSTCVYSPTKVMGRFVENGANAYTYTNAYYIVSSLSAQPAADKP